MCFTALIDHAAIWSPVATTLVCLLWYADSKEVDWSFMPEMRLLVTISSTIPMTLIGLCAAGYL